MHRTINGSKRGQGKYHSPTTLWGFNHFNRIIQPEAGSFERIAESNGSLNKDASYK
jgi:hypothetical protein